MLVRSATKELHGQRPLIAAMMALFDLCSASGLAQVIAVAQKDHVYLGRWRRRHRVQRDYDALWVELAGHFDGSAWHFEPERVRRDNSNMPARKRAMYQRRYAMEDQISAQVACALRRIDLLR